MVSVGFEKQEGNIIDSARVATAFCNSDYQFEVSSRMIISGADAIDYLKIYYPYLDVTQIESVFGNAVYPSRFYGGRSYKLEHSLTDDQIASLNRHGKGVSFTMTGHYFDEQVYQANLHFLERHHHKGNAIVCTNDELAKRIRADFPDYLLKASLIKHLNTLEKVERALETYDRVVIPMDKNDDDAFLESLPEKSRIVLFANANCAYNCPARTCYAAISQSHWGRERTSACSKKWMPRPDTGHLFFDVDKFFAMGFSHFKLVPRNSAKAEQFLRLQVAKKRAAPAASVVTPAARIHSFPKCGRTWLRTLLAHYFERHFSLHVPIDLQTLFTIIPNAHAGLKGVECYQFNHVAEMPLLLASHATVSKCEGGDILLLRGIPDVMVSDYFQQQKLGAFDGSLENFITSDQGSLKRYCRYLNELASDGKWQGMHLLTYEALSQNTAVELTRLLQHLNVVVDEGDVEAAVSASSFDAMQQAEKLTGHAGMPAAAHAEMLKVRKGKVGGYTDYLSQAEIEQMQTIAAGLLTDQAVTMLHHAGLMSTSF